MSSLRRLAYCLLVLCPHGTSAKPARGAKMHTLQQSSEVVAAVAVADSDAPEVGAAGTGAMPVHVFVLAAVASVVGPRLYGLRMSADRMADCTQKLQVTVSAAVESRQTKFNSHIVQHVQFFLGPMYVQPVAICLIWCQVSRFQRPL